MSVSYTNPDSVSDMKVTDPPTYGQTTTGYGGKIPTRYKVKYLDRWRRVYMMQYANSGSAYIVVSGQDVFLDSDTEHRLWER